MHRWRPRSCVSMIVNHAASVEATISLVWQSQNCLDSSLHCRFESQKCLLSSMAEQASLTHRPESFCLVHHPMASNPSPKSALESAPGPPGQPPCTTFCTCAQTCSTNLRSPYTQSGKLRRDVIAAWEASVARDLLKNHQRWRSEAFEALLSPYLKYALLDIYKYLYEIYKCR